MKNLTSCFLLFFIINIQAQNFRVKKVIHDYLGYSSSFLSWGNAHDETIFLYKDKYLNEAILNINSNYGQIILPKSDTMITDHYLNLSSPNSDERNKTIEVNEFLKNKNISNSKTYYDNNRLKADINFSYTYYNNGYAMAKKDLNSDDYEQIEYGLNNKLLYTVRYIGNILEKTLYDDSGKSIQYEMYYIDTPTDTLFRRKISYKYNQNGYLSKDSNTTGVKIDSFYIINNGDSTSTFIYSFEDSIYKATYKIDKKFNTMGQLLYINYFVYNSFNDNYDLRDVLSIKYDKNNYLVFVKRGYINNNAYDDIYNIEYEEVPIDENNIQVLYIFPNPSNNKIYFPIYLKYDIQKALIKIFNLQGQEVLSKEILERGDVLNYSLDFDLSNSEYIIMIYADGKPIARNKFIVNH